MKLTKDPSKMDRNAQLAKNLREFLGQGLTLQFMGGMTSERMYAAFETAKTMYAQNHYEDALAIIKYLCLQNHMNKAYFMYLGACYQKLQRPEMATKAYAHAAVLDPSDPRPHFNASICYLTMKDLAGAEYAAADAQVLSDTEIWCGELQLRIEALQKAITHQKMKVA